jgi:CheY-like chemotaxis protein
MRYRQVLFNLLSNAIKFTPDSGSVAVTVRNDDQDNPNEVVVAVKDTGIGIKEENVKLLFAPFSQLDSSICRKFGGSGLGLAISRRLCSAMGGWIECESEPGHGSTFTCRFLLPVVDSVDQAKKAKQEEEERDGNVQDKFPGLKVLLVEDNSINQKVGKRMLNALGCTVTVADNGEECLHILEEKTYDHGFDIVLMDCQMPVMDGFQATEHIRAVEAQRLQETGGAPTRIRPLPIVALTASATKEYAQRCLEVGMSDVLFKPLRREALGAALRKWQPNPPGHSPATAPSSC